MENCFDRNEKKKSVLRALESPEFSESLDRRSINLLAWTYKTNKKTAVVRPSPL